MADEMAVRVCEVEKSYGTSVVLDSLTMDVPYGSIYGLLGSSGCGKTTLLRCILGQFNLAKGEITVLGKAPGSVGHKVPGRDVGYMPQETALYGDFTMRETLYYFGILHRMGLKAVRERGLFLQELLELPPLSKLIRTLSGGQKRRFSFAVAMLQEPPLMILDEPTVGVDPILRAKIWEHLMELTVSNRTTIIITTHYIEEARQAHLVGMMRDGKLLAEAPPSSLIQLYRLNNLEEVFLLLCRKQDRDHMDATEMTSSSSPLRRKSPAINNDDSNEATPLIQNQKRGNNQMSTFSERMKHQASVLTSSLVTSCKCRSNPLSSLPRGVNIVALCWKNIMRIYRNPGLLIFQFLIPAFQIMLFCLAIGQNLTNINVAYTNDDIGLPFHQPLTSICNNTDVDNGLINVSSFGELYISKLKEDNTFNLIEYDRVEDAIAQVNRGNDWAAIYLGQNFTVDLMLRVCSIYPSRCYNKSTAEPLSNSTINGSSIHVYADVTNLQISVTISNQTLQGFELFMAQLIHSCKNVLDLNTSLLSPPIINEPPIYGRRDLSFTDYMAPGMITSITFGISIGLCAIALVVERKEGLIDRTWVAGVNTAEIIIAQVFTQFFILVVQITLLLVVAIFGFKVYTAHLPNLWAIGALAMLQGLTGMAFGLFLSAVSPTENAAVQVAIAVFYPTMLLSGVLWPLEGMPIWLRYISYSLPGTFPAEAMRAMMGRGWGLEYLIVWRGFLMTTGWFLVFLVLTGLAFNMH